MMEDKAMSVPWSLGIQLNWLSESKAPGPAELPYSGTLRQMDPEALRMGSSMNLPENAAAMKSFFIALHGENIPKSLM